MEPLPQAIKYSLLSLLPPQWLNNVDSNAQERWESLVLSVNASMTAVQLPPRRRACPPIQIEGISVASVGQLLG